jgi:hypothetical protein
MTTFTLKTKGKLNRAETARNLEHIAYEIRSSKSTRGGNDETHWEVKDLLIEKVVSWL